MSLTYLIISVYVVKYMQRLSHVKNSQVIMQNDDNSCHIQENESNKFCFNQFSGINHFIIKKDKGITDNCPYIPTRISLTEGDFLTAKNGIMVFLSDKEKNVFKLEEKVDICGCSETWKTNYQGIYLRSKSGCSIISPTMLPPSSINSEHSINLKLDYIMFKNENTSRYFYKALYTGMSETQYRSSKQYFSIARKVKEIGLFEIKRPIFAR